MNLSHGVNSGGIGVNNLKGSLGRANSTSNVLGVNKSNQGKKPLIVASQAGPMLASSAYVALQSLREVLTSVKPNLFIRKLNMCCVVFDFSYPSKNLKKKDIKWQTLLELVDYITKVTSKFIEIVVQEIMKMVSINLFRIFPSGNFDSIIPESYDPEEEEPTMEPSWPHLQIAYEFLLRFVASSEIDAKIAKRYIDHSFVLRLLDLYDYEDKRERDYLKTILHCIYGKFMVHRPFIRKAINNIFFRFIFETKKHNGVAELLEILESIINGFVLPLNEEHKLFLFVEKDIKLVDMVIRGLLKYWPITNSLKEVMFLGELEEVLEATQIAVKDIIMKNPQSKYLDADHDPLVQVFGPMKKGCVNFMGPDISMPLLRKEAVVHFMNFHEHIATTGRALVLPGLQESEEAEYKVIVDIIFEENSPVLGQRGVFFYERLIGTKIKFPRILLRFAY
ncbi:hypothetical protein GIB67_041636 [Kingdonia uniflora]|uniref:Uncharacterized protein n=1 Tax=Kingdonia uniflora TaxID=39325 RepID=A0A7J7MQH6_9MAGN|nr:hypothetical protein GIB67_041636 [Kingdonia uniflora]